MAVNTVKIDTSQVERNLRKLGLRGKVAAKKARAEVGDELLRLSNIEVPLDEGTLASSGVSEDAGNDDHVVGYNTPYAARLHEHPEYNFQHGKKGKFLEDPIKENQKAFTTIFGNVVERELTR